MHRPSSWTAAMVGMWVLAACAGVSGGGTGGAVDTTVVTRPPSTSISVAPTTPSSTEPATEPATLTVVTFNAGLAPGYVDLAAERVPLVAEALATTTADLVVLQEVWAPEDAEAIAAAVEEQFPEQCYLELAPEATGEAPCDPAGLESLASCARTSCAGVPPDELAACVLTHCGAEYAALSGGCQTCLAANIGGDIDQFVGSCTVAGARYAYGGSFGLGLLSRHPIESWEETVLESSLNRRAVIHAVVQAEGLGTVHVFATHLTGVFADVPYPGDGTWDGEQRAQIEALLALVEEVPAGVPVLVLGDLNTGPALPGIAPEVAENYRLLTASGLGAPYVDGVPDPGCTFCAENPLVRAADGESVLIDHVLVRGLRATGVDRVLDQPVTIDGSESRLSDHYGVAVTLAAP